jgi:hypothetical protein
VKDLVIAHRRQWGWRFVGEFCWRKTDNGVPGGWGNRFKNAWEAVFHFARQQQIKFRPEVVGHKSEDCFDYSPNNPKSRSGSGILGTGARGAAADGGKNRGAWGRTRSSLSSDSEGRHTGMARPCNVIEVKSEFSQGSHSAPFPRALVEFFLLAFSDAGDVVFEPFVGSGTTMAAAEFVSPRRVNTTGPHQVRARLPRRAWPTRRLLGLVLARLRKLRDQIPDIRSADAGDLVVARAAVEMAVVARRDVPKRRRSHQRVEQRIQEWQ